MQKPQVTSVEANHDLDTTVDSHPSRRPKGSTVRQPPKPANKPPSGGNPPPPSERNQYWDANDLRENVTITEVLAHFNISPNADDNIHCIMPDHDDRNPSMHVVPGGMTLHCFACNKTVDSVNAYQILSRHQGNFYDLCRKMGETFDVPPSEGTHRIPCTRSFRPQQKAPPPQAHKPAPISCGDWKSVAHYVYQSLDGKLVLKVERLEREVRMPDGSRGREKRFFQNTRTPAGSWRKGYGPEGQPQVMPYRWERLKSVSTDVPKVVFFVEGEKDVDNLISVGLLATCVPGSQKSDWNVSGAGILTVPQIEALALLGCMIVIIPDADKEGWRKGLGNLQVLSEVREDKALSLSLALLDLEFPYGSKKDASDWLAEGGTAEALLELLEVQGFDFNGPDWPEQLQALKEYTKTQEVEHAQGN